MRLSRRDWQLLERVRTSQWERWLQALGYVSSGYTMNRFDMFSRDGLDVFLPVDKSVGDYKLRLSETIDAVAEQNTGVSVVLSLSQLMKEEDA